jgi:hypothetical protein
MDHGEIEKPEVGLPTERGILLLYQTEELCVVDIIIQ